MENPKPPLPETKEETSNFHSSIKTLQKDVEDFVKGERPSLISLLARGAQRPLEQENKPSSLKRWLSTLAVIFSGMTLIGLGIYAYILIRRSIPQPPPPPPPLPESRIPLKGDNSITFTIDSNTPEGKNILREEAQKREETGRITEILFASQEKNVFPPDVLIKILGATLPTDIVEEISEIKFYIHYSFFGGKLLVVAALKDTRKTLLRLEQEEKNLPNMLKPIFLDDTVEVKGTFISQSYHNIDFKKLAINQERDSNLIYGLIPFKNILIFSSTERGFAKS